MQNPKLSIGIIFKNEIRCIERCLQSLEPLRKAVPCEVVMADTGSDDGSREVAEKYADILFDFPWIDDFAAARNAVMDRCSGTWYLSIDCDEWLDEDVSSLTRFIGDDGGFELACIVIRNYKMVEPEKMNQFSDFVACRLVRMSTGKRFIGAIHEHWPGRDDGGTQHLKVLQYMIVHHDGYAIINPEWSKEKSKRNLSILKKQLEDDPDNLLLLMQCIESSGSNEEHLEYAKKAAQGVEEKRSGWDTFGAPIFRHAVISASLNKAPELEEWIQRAREWFPDSLFTQIDVNYIAFGNSWSKDDYAACIEDGEAYLAGMDRKDAGKFDMMEVLCSTLGYASPHWRLNVASCLAAAYLYEKKPEDARRVLKEEDGSLMDVKQTGDFIRTCAHLHGRSNVQTDDCLQNFWEQISQPKPNQTMAERRRAEFTRMSSEVFLAEYRNTEEKREDYCRYAYTLFLPLLGRKDCELGTAAAVLETEDRAELEKLLGMVKKWDEFPASALEHALRAGVRFPLPGKPLRVEEMDALAGRMVRKEGPLTELAVRAAEGDFAAGWQELLWARALALAAVKFCGWKEEGQRMERCRAFAAVEGAFLPRYYAEELLCDENIHALPPLHRFGWYCGRAFRALDAGDSAGYVRLLRQGLEMCAEMKDMAEYLLKELEESRRVRATPELLALAEQVRAVLAQYDPNDPAVEALKQSPAYRQVSHLIEGPELGIYEGVKQ